MSTQSLQSRGTRRALMLVIGLLTSIVAFTVGSQVALAHHSELTPAKVNCAKTVSWTAVAWGPSTDERRTNNSVKVWYKNAGSDTKIDVATGFFKPSNGFTFNGTFQWPATNPTSLTVFVQEQVKWGPSQNIGGIAAARSVTVNRPADCGTNVAAVCSNGNGTVTITLTNTSTAGTVKFNVTPPGGSTTTYDVNAGTPKSIVINEVADNPAYTVTIKVGDQDYSKTIAIACDRPGTPVTNIKLVCADGNGTVTVTLKNTIGELPVTFTVTAPGGSPTNYTVQPLSQVEVPFTNVADTPSYAVTIKVGNTDYSKAILVDCDRAGTPVTNINMVCADGNGTVTVTLKNTIGELPVTFTVTAPGGSPTNYTVQPLSQVEVPFANVADTAAYTVTIKVGADDFSKTIAVACDRPGTPVTNIKLACADGNGTVTVTLLNTVGELPVTFTVTAPGGSPTNYTVQPLSQVEVPFANVADTPSYMVTITVGNTDYSKDIAVNCDRAGTPVTNINVACADGNGTVTVTLLNTVGELPVTFTVTAPGGSPKDYTVDPLSQVEVPFANVADTPSYMVTITVGTDDYSKDIAVSCDRPGTPVTNIELVCVDGDGTVTVTLKNTIGELPVTFTVTAPGGSPKDYTVQPLSQVEVPFANVADTTAYMVTITVGNTDHSKEIAVNCDRPGTGSATPSSVCVDYDGAVTIVLAHTGGDLAVQFVVEGTTYTVQPGDSESVVIGDVSDGPFTTIVKIAGADTTVTLRDVECDPVLTGSPLCATTDTDGNVVQYWYTVNNAQSDDISFTWTDGAAVAPANGSVTISSAASHIDLSYKGVKVGTADSSDETCGTTVNFDKVLLGQPATGESYTILVSRLVDGSYVEELTFNIDAGVPQSFKLPATFDPAGITYKVEEIGVGTSSTHVVSPDSFTLQGNLGETVNVVITNGYASVEIDKQVSAATVKAGETLVYTLAAKNTGGLTLDPVVISDSLPGNLSMVSALVADDKGACVLARSTRPQLITCELNDALAPGASAPIVTVVARVDLDSPAATEIVNQAKVLGAFSDAPNQVTEGETLSCLPVVDGTVCDLSAAVVSVVEAEIRSEPPVAPPAVPVVPAQGVVTPPPAAIVDAPVLTPPPVNQLPVTGSSGLGNMVGIGFLLLSLGGVSMLSRRRRASNS